MAIVSLSTDDVKTDIQGGVDFSYSKDGASKLFMMMSDYLYSDKEYAVLSELSANAFDAHAMVGKTEVPFKVNLPTNLERELVVRDYGPGMSEENVYRFLTQYGESSKGDTNDQVGFWGIGAKSPAAVSDNWSVISHHEGQRTHYEVFITTQGVPTLKKIFTGETDETGLEVRIPITKSTWHVWEAAAVKAFTHYKVKPEINTGIKIPVVEYAITGNNWARRVGSYAQGKLVTTMREYNVDTEKVFEDIPKDDPIRFIFGVTTAGGLNKFDLFFGIGEIDLSISREQLQYTPKTISAIKTRLKEIVESLSKEITDDLSQYTTNIAYRGAVSKWFDKLGTGPFLTKLVNGKFDIREIPRDIKTINVMNIPEDHNLTMAYHGSNKKVKSNSKTLNSAFFSTSIVWNSAKSKYDPIYSLSIEKFTNIVVVIKDTHDAVSRAKYASSSNRDTFYLVTDKNIFPKETKKVKASSLEKPPRVVREKNTDIKLDKLYYMSGERFLKISEIEYKNLDKNRVAIVNIVDGRVMDLNPEANTPEVRFLKEMRFTILGTKEKLTKKFMTPAAAIQSLYDTYSKDTVIQSELESARIADMTNKLMSSPTGILIVKTIISSPQWDLLVKPVQEVINYYHKHNSIPHRHMGSNVKRFYRVCELANKQPPASTIVDVAGVIESIKKTYPVLEFMDTGGWYSSRDGLADAIQSYVNLVDCS